MAATSNRQKYVGSLVLGFVAVPAIALATGLTWSGEAVIDAEATTTTAPVASSSPGTEQLISATDEIEDDEIPFDTALADACGPAGLALVSKEESGEITELEQGVLDALREVCLENDLPLPEKVAPLATQQVVIVEEVVEVQPPATTTAQNEEDFEGEDDEEDHEEEEEEEDEEDEEEEGGGSGDD